MFFKSKIPMHNYGDTRVIQRFAWFPTQVLNYKDWQNTGTVWLEKYDVVQKFYVTIGWHDDVSVVLGTGIVRAVAVAKIYDGKVIE